MKIKEIEQLDKANWDAATHSRDYIKGVGVKHMPMPDDESMNRPKPKAPDSKLGKSK